MSRRSARPSTGFRRATSAARRGAAEVSRGPRGGAPFAFRLAEIAGVAVDRKLTSLPSPVPELLGLAGLRGRLVPVYSLTALLGGTPEGTAGRWLVLDCGRSRRARDRERGRLPLRAEGGRAAARERRSPFHGDLAGGRRRLRNRQRSGAREADIFACRFGAAAAGARHMTFGKKLLAGFGISFSLFIANRRRRLSRHRHPQSDERLGGPHPQGAREHAQAGGRPEGGRVRRTRLRDHRRGAVLGGRKRRPRQSCRKPIQALRELTADNPIQQQRLDVAEPLIRGRVAELNRVIEVRRISGFDAAEKAIVTGSGVRVADELRGIMGQMEASETQLLKLRIDDSEAAASVARATLVYGTSLCAVAVLVVTALLNSSLSGTGLGRPAHPELVGRAAGRGEPAGDRRPRSRRRR